MTTREHSFLLATRAELQHRIDTIVANRQHKSKTKDELIDKTVKAAVKKELEGFVAAINTLLGDSPMGIPIKNPFRGDRLTMLRKSYGLTQSELGDRLGVSMQAVNFWEVGRCQPSEESLENILALFKRSRDYFFKKNRLPKLGRFIHFSTKSKQ